MADLGVAEAVRLIAEPNDGAARVCYDALITPSPGAPHPMPSSDSALRARLALDPAVRSAVRGFLAHPDAPPALLVGQHFRAAGAGAEDLQDCTAAFHVIPDVAVLSRRSDNRRTYDDAALAEAVALVEGALVYDGKDGADPRPLGVLARARFDRPSARVRALLLLDRTHRRAPFVLACYERMDGDWGLSIDGEGTFYRDLVEQDAPDQVAVVWSVRLVGFVRRPACRTSCAD